MLARHVADLTGPSSECFVQAVCADLACGNTRTARHVQPLQSCRKNFSLQLCNGWSVEKYAYYHIPNLRIQLVKKTLLMMDR